MRTLILSLSLLAAFTANAYECKEEAHRLEMAEDYLWLLKVSKEVTASEYSIALSRYENVKHTYDVCVTDYEANR
ncbi:exported hypothetical protein [Vibrio crassostreae]|nr:exported hypothetical protein [Vibrio crassostreae]CAK2335500.1 exported hypothetical protein [Vibrio crassostreae]CAK2503986.1 exported hypothetical protein [Vibrio crassostreae]CAK2909405.1 exported hypothetical protein [Vibrio crassostreae]